MASRKINVGIIGTGWIGEIRAKVCAHHPLVESVHVAEIDPAKLARVGEETRAKTATTDYHELLRQDDIDAIFVCSTPRPHIIRLLKTVSSRASTPFWKSRWDLL